MRSNTVLNKALPLLLAALMLPACSSDWMRRRERSDEVYLTPPSRNYRAEIVAFMRSYLNDPRGIREAYVSEPSKRTLEGIERYAVCLRYNPRKANGQHAGSRDNVVLFAEGRVDRVIDAPNAPDQLNPRELCKDAAYQPLPELERISR